VEQGKLEWGNLKPELLNQFSESDPSGSSPGETSDSKHLSMESGFAVLTHDIILHLKKK
jgi:hypothetical protein